MKILIIHNNYTSRGGEESVVEFQTKLFREMGHEVILYQKQNIKYSNILKKICRFMNGFFNVKSYFEMRRIIKANKPDVAIVHNLYHLITPSALIPLKRASIPVFMVLHNYRVLCPLATMFRGGGVCRECMTRDEKEFCCVLNNCTNNLAESIFVSLRNLFVRKSHILTKNVDTFIALSEFQKNVLVSYGFKASQITVIPNAINIDTTTPLSMPKDDYLAFVGRMTPEKGIDVLFDLALRMPDIKFKVAGDNTIPQHIKAPLNIEFCGYLSSDLLSAFYTKAVALVMTSKCYEGFPVVVLEAFKHKTAVIVPRLGAMPNIVDDNINGMVYDAFELGLLVDRIRATSKYDFETMGIKGYQKIEGNYDSMTYYNSYINLFENDRRGL
ncbi:MAG: glycosyltransferase family 4 protein [Rikenellaceae bacterium]